MNSLPSSPAPVPAHSRWKALLLITCIFFLGGACGVGGGLLVVRHLVQRSIAHPDEAMAPVDHIIAHLESEITAELDLTPAERAAIQPELMQAAVEFKRLRQETWQKAGLNVRQTLDRISRHLPPAKTTALRAAAARRLQPWGLMPEGSAGMVK